MMTADALVAQAEMLTEQGRPDEAVALYTQALSLDAEHVEALLGAGHLALTLSMAEDSRSFIERALTLEPDNLRGKVLQALLQEATESLDQGLALLQPLAQKHKDNTDVPDVYGVLFHTGRMLGAAGRHQEALEYLEVAAAMAPQNAQPHYVAGMIHHAMSAMDHASEAFGRAIDADPKDLDSYITLVDVLAEAGQWDAAQDVLTQAAALFPEMPIVPSKQAAVSVKQGDLPGALEALQRQVALTPDDVSAHVSLASVALMGGDAQAFAEVVEAMMERHPDEWQTQQLRATLLDMADRPEDAIEALRKAHQLAPHEWKPLNDLGDLLNAKAQSDPTAAAEAVDVLTEACQLAPTDVIEPRYNLALAYWNAGHKERAQEAASLLVQHGPPEHPLIAQTKEVLSAMVSAGK